MTKRPIFIGATTLLAEALTAGLAFGAGGLVGSQTPSPYSGQDQTRDAGFTLA